MDLFSVLNLIGGLSLFLFGMSIMGQALEKRAGGKLRTLLERMTGSKTAGFLTGLGVTAIIQSSSVTTVMVVGFVNSGLLALKQAINVIMGANVGTTVTAWLLSLSGISGDALWLKKDTGMILLGFATLMFGMETMSSSVSGLKDVPGFQKLFLLFTNPILGVLTGAVITGIIQSSSASVGILQALATTGQVTYGAVIPIIMGQNIGTCVTALISSVGANKNAKRAAVVHLLFNMIGTLVWLSVFYIVRALFQPALLNQPASMFGIAIAHSVFNVLCTILLLPFSEFLEKLALRIVPDKDGAERAQPILDERLLATPPLALGRCHDLVTTMAEDARDALLLSLEQLYSYNPADAWKIREIEDITDKYEDEIGSYLIKLSAKPLNESDSGDTTALLKYIGDFERIADHAVGILESAEEMQVKGVKFSQEAESDLAILRKAVEEIMRLALDAYRNNDPVVAVRVEPLEEVIDSLKEQMRTRHILRMKKEACSIEAGFIWSDLLTNLERIADHCSNIAGCIIDMGDHRLALHDTLRKEKSGESDFDSNFSAFSAKYSLKTSAYEAEPEAKA